MKRITHHLKTWPEYFEKVAAGDKTFEVRIDDRNFCVGDRLILQEFDKDKGYTGSFIEKEVSYKLNGGAFGIESGYCVLGLSHPSNN